MSQAGTARGSVDAAHRLRTIVIALFVVNAIAAWAEVLGMFTLGERAWQSLGHRVIEHPIETHLQQLEITRRVHGVVWLATVPVFLMWIRRIHWNVSVLGSVTVPFSSRAAVAAFLVPLVNLVVPVRVVRALWRASAPDDAPPPVSRSPLVPCWWALVVVAAVLDPFWSRIPASVTEVALGGPTLLLTLGQLTEIAAAVLGVAIVYSIDALHVERWHDPGGVE